MKKNQQNQQQQVKKGGYEDFRSIMDAMNGVKDHATKLHSHTVEVLGDQMDAGFDGVKKYTTETAVAAVENVNDHTDGTVEKARKDLADRIGNINGAVSTGFKVFVGVLVVLALIAIAVVIWKYTTDESLKIQVIDQATQAVKGTKPDLNAIVGWCFGIIGVTGIIAALVRVFAKN